MDLITLLLERIQLLTPELQEFICGPFIPELANTMGVAEGLEGDDLILLRYELYLYAMVMNTATEFRAQVASMFNMTGDQATIFTNTLLEAFPEGFSEMHDVTYTFLQTEETTSTQVPITSTTVNTSSQITTSSSPETNNLAAEIAAAEAALHQVQPMRTMAHDMAATRTVQTQPSHPQQTVTESQPPVQTPAATPQTTTPSPTPPAASVAAAAADQVPNPRDLVQPAADPNNLVADGPGNQVRNPDASWG